ncbi:MAG: D-alanyl-D-alanine carboxypeptidase family protein [Patescibacteria group bacterium]
MFLDVIKLALAGLMVVGDLFGATYANLEVLNMAKKLGINDPNQIRIHNPAASKELDLPDIDLSNIAPYEIDPLSYPIIEATSAVVIDVDTSAILYTKNADEQRAMASVTKLMTAVVALDNIDMGEVITIAAADTNVEPVVMGLLPGEEIYAGEVLKGLLIKSGNDAALTLARVGGDGSVDSFIGSMNQKAAKLGLRNTHFVNPHGLDADGQYSSARDLALLAKYAMQNPTIVDIVRTKEMTVTSVSGDVSHYLQTTNELLDSYLNVQGVKTGFTDNAGQVLITQAEKDGHRVMAVVMNSPDRFQESKILLDWGFNNFYWE